MTFVLHCTKTYLIFDGEKNDEKNTFIGMSNVTIRFNVFLFCYAHHYVNKNINFLP